MKWKNVRNTIKWKNVHFLKKGWENRGLFIWMSVWCRNGIFSIDWRWAWWCDGWSMICTIATAILGIVLGLKIGFCPGSVPERNSFLTPPGDYLFWLPSQTIASETFPFPSFKPSLENAYQSPYHRSLRLDPATRVWSVAPSKMSWPPPSHWNNKLSSRCWALPKFCSWIGEFPVTQTILLAYCLAFLIVLETFASFVDLCEILRARARILRLGIEHLSRSRNCWYCSAQSSCRSSGSRHLLVRSNVFWAKGMGWFRTLVWQDDGMCCFWNWGGPDWSRRMNIKLNWRGIESI